MQPLCMALLHPERGGFFFFKSKKIDLCFSPCLCTVTNRSLTSPFKTQRSKNKPTNPQQQPNHTQPKRQEVVDVVWVKLWLVVLERLAHSTANVSPFCAIVQETASLWNHVVQSSVVRSPVHTSGCQTWSPMCR